MDVERIRPTPESIIHPPRHRRGPLRKAAPAWFLPPAALLVLLWAVPLGALTWRGLRAGALPFASDPMVVQALRLSLVTSTVAAFLVVLTGTPLAYALSRWEFRGRREVEVLIDLTLVLPPSVAGVALLIAFGRRGVLGPVLSEVGISLPFTTAGGVIAQMF